MEKQNVDLKWFVIKHRQNIYDSFRFNDEDYKVTYFGVTCMIVKKSGKGNRKEITIRF
jgi:hypothetical protein